MDYRRVHRKRFNSRNGRARNVHARAGNVISESPCNPERRTGIIVRVASSEIRDVPETQLGRKILLRFYFTVVLRPFVRFVRNNSSSPRNVVGPESGLEIENVGDVRAKIPPSNRVDRRRIPTDRFRRDKRRRAVWRRFLGTSR